MLCTIDLPPEKKAGLQDDRGGMCGEAVGKILRDVAKSEGFSDLLCVAKALQVSCAIGVGFPEGPFLGFVRWVNHSRRVELTTTAREG